MFRQLAATISSNANRYKSLIACRLMAGRLKSAYRRSGAYGCHYQTYRDVLWEIQLRAVAIQGEELDRKWAES